MHAKSLQSCLTLCNLMDCSLSGFPVHGILQARISERVTIPPPGDLPNPGIKSMPLTSPELAGMFFATDTTWEAFIVLVADNTHILKISDI